MSHVSHILVSQWPAPPFSPSSGVRNGKCFPCINIRRRSFTVVLSAWLSLWHPGHPLAVLCPSADKSVPSGVETPALSLWDTILRPVVSPDPCYARDTPRISDCRVSCTSQPTSIPSLYVIAHTFHPNLDAGDIFWPVFYLWFCTTSRPLRMGRAPPPSWISRFN